VEAASAAREADSTPACLEADGAPVADAALEFGAAAGCGDFEPGTIAAAAGTEEDERTLLGLDAAAAAPAGAVGAAGAAAVVVGAAGAAGAGSGLGAGVGDLTGGGVDGPPKKIPASSSIL